MVSLLDIKKKIDEALGPPAEGIKTLRELTSGETGKQLDHLLARVEKLSKDTSALPQILELFKIIERLGQQGYLKELDDILKHIPKGTAGRELVTELRKAIEMLSPKLDMLSNLAKVLMEKE